MSLPDNRIRFSGPGIDFENEVGRTGQDHDDYPQPYTQARYDWMRMFLIGLLSCQSSKEEPTQYRDGTWWFDLNTLTMKIRRADQWVPAAQVIATGTITLDEMYEEHKALMTRVATIEARLGIS